MKTPQASPASSALLRMAARRSVTVPARLELHARQASVEIGAAEGIETLYVHPSARVVSFTSAAQSISSPSSAASAASLPWRSSTERTLASGLLEIYRVPGSVSFLHSGTLLHAILPRSQCWCVDGVSVFVFRVLPNQYYRIELPGETDEDLKLVEELKITFKKVLHYERTVCPFQRGFAVELPEAAAPVARPKSMYSLEPAKKWKLDGVWRPEDHEARSRYRAFTAADSYNKGHEKRTEKEEQEELTQPEQPEEAEEAEEDEVLDGSPCRMRRPRRERSADVEDVASGDETPRAKAPSTLQSGRSITAPPQLTLIASPPSKNESSLDATGTTSTATTEPIPAMPPTTEISKEDAEIAAAAQKLSINLQQAQKDRIPDRDAPLSAISQTTDRGVYSEDDAVESRGWSRISTPSLSSDSEDHSWGEVCTPPPTLRMKKTRQGAAASKTPSREQPRAVTNGLVRKTVGIILEPPSNLVNVMLKIAARLSKGAFDMTVKSPIGSPHRVPGSWYLGDEEDDWEVDGYGFSGRMPTLPKRSTGGHGDWDVD